MNLITKVKESNGYLRIFSEQWEETKGIIQESNTEELDLIDLPFSWGNLRYLFLREHENSEIVTVMFKIPMNLIPYEELWSKWGKRRRKQLTEFLMAWLIRSRIEEYKVKKWHVHHTYTYAFISVPKFMKGRLFSHLSAFGMIFKEVSPEYVHINCQNCNTNFRFRTMTNIKKHSCPNCGSISFAR
jgi:hypothetical protein